MLHELLAMPHVFVPICRWNLKSLVERTCLECRLICIVCRFIPLQDWPRLLLSLFALHNETRASCSTHVICWLIRVAVNIHTHLIPFLLWSFAWFRLSPSYDLIDQYEPAKVTFTVFALLCLFTSALWHTMAGCAHLEGMEFCARVDYVGIGW